MLPWRILTRVSCTFFPDRVGATWCSGAIALLPGPRIVQECTVQGNLHTAIRFLGVDGSVSAEWTFHGFITLLHVSPDGKTLALDFPGPAGKSPLLTPHDVVIFNTADRTESQNSSSLEGRRESVQPEINSSCPIRGLRSSPFDYLGRTTFLHARVSTWQNGRQADL